MKIAYIQKAYIKFMILLLSLTFIIVGVIREEQFVVLKKAINICLECIGIG